MPSSLASRIAAARRYAKLSQQALADKIGVSRPAVSQWETEDPEKGTAPSRDNLALVAKYTGASMEWLLDDTTDLAPDWLLPSLFAEESSGQYAVERHQVQQPSADYMATSALVPIAIPDAVSALAESVPLKQVQTEPDMEPHEAPYIHEDAIELQRFALAVQRDFVFVPLLDMRVAAGAGRDDASNTILNWYAFRKQWLTEDMRMDPKHCGLVVARGDSGEPEIRDRDLLLVDFRVNSVREPGTYVLEIDGEHVVKQAQRNWDGSVTISSINPAYVPSTVPAGRTHELRVIGQVRSQQRRR
jgi:phage repressor protein C with HTH and peptisase S24 domain/DNA-binding XRE family transcriptional regulator